MLSVLCPARADAFSLQSGGGDPGLGSVTSCLPPGILAGQQRTPRAGPQSSRAPVPLQTAASSGAAGPLLSIGFLSFTTCQSQVVALSRSAKKDQQPRSTATGPGTGRRVQGSPPSDRDSRHLRRPGLGKARLRPLRDTPSGTGISPAQVMSTLRQLASKCLALSASIGCTLEASQSRQHAGFGWGGYLEHGVLEECVHHVGLQATPPANQFLVHLDLSFISFYVDSGFVSLACNIRSSNDLWKGHHY